jgi:hypothetical protein
VCYQLCVLLYCTHAQIVVISMVVAFTNTRTKSKMGHDVDGICSRDKKTYFDRPHEKRGIDHNSIHATLIALYWFTCLLFSSLTCSM